MAGMTQAPGEPPARSDRRDPGASGAISAKSAAQRGPARFFSPVYARACFTPGGHPSDAPSRYVRRRSEARSAGMYAAFEAQVTRSWQRLARIGGTRQMAERALGPRSRYTAPPHTEGRASSRARKGVQSPDEGAGLSAHLERTIARCAGAVRHVTLQHGLDPADVDEVFQDVRIRLWRSLESGEKIAAVPTSYVYKTATCAALDLIRKRRAHREEPLDAHSRRDLVEPARRPGPEGELVCLETMEAVSRALEGLIESRRVVVRMHLAGYRMEEIATLLGWTRHKTRNLLYRGLHDLRHTLEERGLRPRGHP